MKFLWDKGPHSMNLAAYCINLDSRPDRWERMCRRFAEDRLTVERFPAVTDRDPRVPAAFEEGSGLSPRIAACALSHRDVWRLALSRGLRRALILEDDVFFQREWQKITEENLGRLDREDPEWDLFLLNATGHHTWEEGLRIARPALFLGGAYVVTARAMERLLGEFESRWAAADSMLVWLQESRDHSYFQFPYLALQEFDDSDIGGSNQEWVLGLRRWFRENYEPHFGHLYQERFRSDESSPSPGSLIGSESKMSLLTLGFSRDRPLQLEALIDSLARHTLGWAGPARVLYRATTPESEEEYRHLATRRPLTLALEHDEDDNWDVQLRRHLAAAELVLFVVDDTIFVADWDARDTISLLRTHPEIAGVSLRLGRNITYCYPIDQAQSWPPDARQLAESPGFWSYRWDGHDGDFGYPLEISSSVYRTADVLRWLGAAPREAVCGPNSLEGFLSSQRHLAAPQLACYETSRAFAAPWNSVQAELLPIRHGGRSAQDWMKLERQRLDVAAYDGYNARSCHEEAPIHLTSRSGPEGELDAVDGVVYINLDRRPDRRLQIEHQLLAVARIDPSRVARVPACDEPARPAVACLRSHIAAIELARTRGWRTALITEDDFTWTEPLALSRVREFLDRNRHDFALALLASFNPVSDNTQSNDGVVTRIRISHNGAGYLVHDSAYERLLELWREALPKLEATGRHWLYANDAAWHVLMQERLCFAFTPPLGFQRPGHSDVSGGWVDNSGGAT